MGRIPDATAPAPASVEVGSTLRLAGIGWAASAALPPVAAPVGAPDPPGLPGVAGRLPDRPMPESWVGTLRPIRANGRISPPAEDGIGLIRDGFATIETAGAAREPRGCGMVPTLAGESEARNVDPDPTHRPAALLSACPPSRGEAGPSITSNGAADKERPGTSETADERSSRRFAWSRNAHSGRGRSRRAIADALPAVRCEFGIPAEEGNLADDPLATHPRGSLVRWPDMTLHIGKPDVWGCPGRVLAWRPARSEKSGILLTSMNVIGVTQLMALVH